MSESQANGGLSPKDRRFFERDTGIELFFPASEETATPPVEPHSHGRALMRVTPEVFMWMGSGMFEVVANPLPADAALVGAFYDGERHTFTVIVESESFAPVKEGDILPELTAPTIRRLPVYLS